MLGFYPRVFLAGLLCGMGSAVEATLFAAAWADLRWMILIGHSVGLCHDHHVPETFCVNLNVYSLGVRPRCHPI